MTNASERDCFVIAPIGEQQSDTRKRSDQVLKHVITPALKECGFKPIRADQISEPGLITSQVIQHVVDDALVIADLTERNPNVFYELALRHAIRKPLVQLIRKGDQIPFDVAGTRTIQVDHHDLDSVEEARREMVAQVRSLERDPSKLETPISVSLDLKLLRQSENPEQRSLADMLSIVAELRTSVGNVEKRLNDPEGLMPRGFVQWLTERVEHPRRASRAFHEMRRDLDVLRADMAAKEDGRVSKKEVDELMGRMRAILNALVHEL